MNVTGNPATSIEATPPGGKPLARQAGRRWCRKSIPFKVKLDVLTSGPCVYCGSVADTIDHDVPVSRGGGDERANLVPACRSCNTRKHTQTGDEFRVHLQHSAAVASRTDVTPAHLVAALLKVNDDMAALNCKASRDHLKAGILIKAMKERGWSWHRIAVQLDLPQRTAGRWLKIAEEYYANPASVDRANENWKLS